MPETVSREFRIDARHPCFDGHFPGDPVVPGVILLDLVRVTVREWKPGFRINAFATAKFHHPLYPDESFTITLTGNGILSFRFICCRGDQKLASGSLTVENVD